MAKATKADIISEFDRRPCFVPQVFRQFYLPSILWQENGPWLLLKVNAVREHMKEFVQYCFDDGTHAIETPGWHDCSDAARKAVCFVRDAYTFSEIPPAFFAVSYFMNGSVNTQHKACGFIDADYGLMFIEPQTAEIIEMTAREFQTIFRIEF